MKIQGHYYRVPNNIHSVVSSVYELSILLLLLQHTDDNGYCFPGQDTLAQRIMSTKQVKRATDTLKKKGFISVTRKWIRGGGINLYYTVNLSAIENSIAQRTDSLMDSQSNGLTGQSLTDSQSNLQRTGSPNNPTHINPTHINQAVAGGTVPPKNINSEENGVTSHEKKATEIRDTFLSFKENEMYASIDFETEFSKFCMNYGDELIKSPVSCCTTWLDNCLNHRERKTDVLRVGQHSTARLKASVQHLYGSPYGKMVDKGYGPGNMEDGRYGRMIDGIFVSCDMQERCIEKYIRDQKYLQRLQDSVNAKPR
jgi:hypothetical protein